MVIAVSLFARGLSSPSPEPKEKPARSRPRHGWFAWWVAACLVALAWSTHQQLQIQERILEKSSALEAGVARAREVMAATNQQLGQVSDVAAATGELEARLERLARLNGDLKRELEALEVTVNGLDRSVIHLDGQALQSLQQLEEIAARSAALHQTLIRSHAIGSDVAAYLEQMVTMQTEVTADLAAMEAKTRFLDQLMGEE